MSVNLPGEHKIPDDYQDQNGKPITLHKLVRKEPGWAESRLRFMREQIAALEAENAALKADLGLSCGGLRLALSGSAMLMRELVQHHPEAAARESIAKVLVEAEAELAAVKTFADSAESEGR